MAAQAVAPPQMKEEQMLDLAVPNTRLNERSLDPHTFLQWSGAIQDSSTHFGLDQMGEPDSNNSSWLFSDRSFHSANVEVPCSST